MPERVKIVEGPVGILTRDITIQFPYIMDEEYKELRQYLKENHIDFVVKRGKRKDGRKRHKRT